MSGSDKELEKELEAEEEKEKAMLAKQERRQEMLKKKQIQNKKRAYGASLAGSLLDDVDEPEEDLLG